MDILFAFLNYLILFILIMIFACIHIWVGRKCSVITTFSLYSVLSSVILLLLSNDIFMNLNFFDGLGEMITNFFSSFISLFSILYTYFINVILSIFKIFSEDVSAVQTFLSNAIFCIALNVILFIICLILFRKKNKNKIERSRYCD